MTAFRSIRRSLGSLFLFGMTILGGITSSALADEPSPPLPREQRIFWSHVDVDGGCVSSSEFARLFEAVSPPGQPWRVYVPRRGNELARAAVARVNRQVGEFWPKYARWLGSAPSTAQRPVRVVVMNQLEEVGDGRRETAGLTATACDVAQLVYNFVPADDSSATETTVAHELFHVFQQQRTPNGEPRRALSNTWLGEGSADLAAQLVTNFVFPTAVSVSAVWTHPEAPLDTFDGWNPAQLDGFDLVFHPYRGGLVFLQALAGYFGVRPGMTAVPDENLQRFGAFLNRTFEGATYLSNAQARAARVDALVDRELRALARTNPVFPDGLGEAYARFASSRMAGIDEILIEGVESLLRDPPESRFVFPSWRFRYETASSFELSVPHGLSAEGVWIATPSSSMGGQIEITITGKLQDQGRLFVQTGNGSHFLAELIVADLSRNARTDENPDAIDGPDAMLSRRITYCDTSERGQFFHWPIGGVKVLLVNAALTRATAANRPVSIGLRVTGSSTPCQTGGRFNPEDPGGRQLKPGSDEPCPDRPASGEATECDLHNVAPRSDDSPALPPPLDPWSTGKTALTLTPGQLLGLGGGRRSGGGGIDCEQNERERERDRRAGRTRTAAERLVDEACASERRRDGRG